MKNRLKILDFIYFYFSSHVILFQDSRNVFLRQYNGDSMVNSIQKYLSINNFADQKDAFEDLFQTHPDYPSLFAITDTLELLSIKNAAFTILKDELNELPNSFLAMHNQDLVLATLNKNTIKIDSDKEGVKSLSIDDFVAGWNGMVLIIEPNETSLNATFKKVLHWLYYSLPVLALLSISIFYNRYNLSASILVLTSILGIVSSIFIVQEKLGLENKVVSKFCNITPSASCNSVINSDKGRINKWIGFSDLPILFFGINLMSLLLNPAGSAIIISILSLLALPIIFYSIWIQKVELKKWCLLCLAISLLIMLQSVILILNNLPLASVAFSNFFVYLFSMIVIGSFWLILSNTLEGKIGAEKEARKLKKFKRNYAFLNFLYKEMPVLRGLDKLEGLKFGNKNADIHLKIILSPNCKHCDNVFYEALELVAKYSEKIDLTVLFNVNPQKKDNPYRVVAERLLEINYSDNVLAMNAIKDWYIKKIGLEKWTAKWKVDSISEKTNLQIEEQHKWCSENGFNYTPIKIVNNKLFPSEYDIIELRYFLNNYPVERDVFEKNNLVQL